MPSQRNIWSKKFRSPTIHHSYQPGFLLSWNCPCHLCDLVPRFKYSQKRKLDFLFPISLNTQFFSTETNIMRREKC